MTFWRGRRWRWKGGREGGGLGVICGALKELGGYVSYTIPHRIVETCMNSTSNCICYFGPSADTVFNTNWFALSIGNSIFTS